MEVDGWKFVLVSKTKGMQEVKEPLQGMMRKVKMRMWVMVMVMAAEERGHSLNFDEFGQNLKTSFVKDQPEL